MRESERMLEEPMERNPPEKLLRVAEAAEQLGLQVSTIRAWILHRRINVIRVGRRAIRIPSSAVQKIIDAGTIPASEGRR
jgi:excisionase family DNA binding protein